MGVIYPNRTLQARQAKPKRAAHRYMRVAAYTALVLLCANLVVAAIYHGKTYPRTYIANHAVGNRRFSDLATLTNEQIVPASVTLTYGQTNTTTKLTDIGLKPDQRRTEQAFTGNRSPLPLVNLFIRHTLPAPITFDDVALQKYGERLLPLFHQPATNARIARNGGTFSVVSGIKGHDISIARLKATLLTGIDNGKGTVAAPITSISPIYTDKAAASEAKQLQESTAAHIALKAGKTIIRPETTAIANWYVPDAAGKYTLDDTAIRAYILQASVAAGTRPQNLQQISVKVKQAVVNHADFSGTLMPFTTTKTFRYCTALRGVDSTNQKALETAAKSAFADPRGWGLEGQVIFEEADPASASCDFTIWLTAADQMPSFGSICDAEWSCRVGPNVVINYTRWLQTSTAWKQYGGSLENYRTMAINHETGHWFGFDHSTCPAAGQPAPVMMQQSISLGGCTFNPWPTARELSVYRSVIGL